MARLKKVFRRLRTLLWTALTLITLLAAVLVGVGKLLMPYSVKYQPQLEAWLSSEFQQPVVVDSFTGEWKAFGPRISLEGVTLQGDGEGDEEIAIQHAALDIKPFNFLLPNRPLYSFRIIGADLSLVRTPDGRYELSGLGVSGRNSGDSDASGLRNITTVGEVRLEDSSLSFDDEERGIHVQLTGMQGRLQMNGRELATELEADISNEGKNRVLGDVKATLLITLGEDQHLDKAQWHVKTGELMISELVNQLPAHNLVPRSGWLNAEIWGDWSQGSNQVMDGVIDLRESVLSETPQRIQLDHLNTRFRWDFNTRKSWRIDLSDLMIETAEGEWETSRMSIERNIPGNLGIWVSADFVDIEFPLQMTQQIMTNYNTRWPRLMPRKMTGELNSFDLVLDSRWKLFQASGQMNGIDAWEWDRYPDVEGISGTLDLQGGEGQIEFGGQDVNLVWPKNFTSPAMVDIPNCSMEILWGEPGAWRIDANSCRIEHEDFVLSGRSRFAGNEGKPELDINMMFSQVNLARLDNYWPRSLMSANVIDWLNRGITAGTSPEGRFVMRGDMDDWPFSGSEGLLLAEAAVEGAELDYVQNWPRAKEIDMALQFRNTTMSAKGTMGSIGGVAVEQVSARIENFKQPVLQLDYQAAAPMPSILGFIKSTPLLDDVDLDLDQFRFENNAQTSGRLVAPLGSSPGELSIAGRLGLPGNRFTELKSGIEIDSIKGEVTYTREGMAGSGLTGRFRDHPAELSMVSDWDGDEVFRARLAGTFPVEQLLPESVMTAEPLLSRISGSSFWDIGLSVSKPPAGTERETWLEMKSDLSGVTMDFPIPLDKPPEQLSPLTVRYPVNAESTALTIELIDKAGMQFDLGEDIQDARRAHIQFGQGLGELPPEGYFSLAGSTSEFDLDQWIDLVIERFSQKSESGGLVFEQAELSAGEMRFLNRSFTGVELSASYENDVLTATVDSEGIAGTMRYSQSDDGAHSLSAELDHLFMPEPIDQGMTMDTDPALLPEMHLYAKEFSYLGMELGETRIEAFPIQNGLRFDSLEAVSPQFNFQARGDWTRDDSGSRSDFNILMTSESIGTLMNAMEISSVLEGGQTILRYDAWWPGPPAAFALAQLNGEMSINVSNGRILNADAGAGRIVGLLSIAELPRRLALDFRDVFGSGFGFDQAMGTITLENGTAHTDDLVLESTAATMAITGKSDLVAQEFDYVMAVRPGVGQTLPALGAVIGGPGGAAAGLALQGLLKKSLGDATEARYTIQGPWSEPSVEPVEVVSANSEDGTVNE